MSMNEYGEIVRDSSSEEATTHESSRRMDEYGEIARDSFSVNVSSSNTTFPTSTSLLSSRLSNTSNERTRNERKKGIIVAGIIWAVVAVFIIIPIIEAYIIIPFQKYNTAVTYMNEGSYTTAFSIFIELNDFKNSSELADSCLYEINETSYANALSYMENEEYDKAISLFEKTQKYSYKDSARLIEKCQNALIEQTYDKAAIMIEQEKYEEAIGYLQEISGYKDSDDLIRKCERLQLVYPIRMAEIGGRVTFGSYEQDGNTDNGAEKITWIVLDKTDNKALLLSEYGLDYMIYDGSFASNTTYSTWETCSLRKWMNETFINSAFTEDELSAIEIVKVRAEKTNGFDTDPGNDTDDRIFALSYNDANVYFQSNEERRCKPTNIASSNTAYKDDKGYGFWWLRSPGHDRRYATLVDEEGVIRELFVDGFDDITRIVNGYSGYDWNYGNATARPAMWVRYN